MFLHFFCHVLRFSILIFFSSDQLISMLKHIFLQVNPFFAYSKISKPRQYRRAHFLRVDKQKKLRKELHCCSSFRSFHFKNGGYLLSHLAGSTIDDVRLNFSVRNGKRWNPDAITTLVFFSFIDRSEKEKKISNQNLFIKKLSGY